MIVFDNLGAGSGAGVIVISTSGFATSMASGDIKEKPGNGPESGRPSALFINPKVVAIRPV